VDIYMPDIKFWSQETAGRLTAALDYPGRAREAIREMHRQVGVLRYSSHGIARRGVLIRHLVMPDQQNETRNIMRWLAEELSPDTFVNIMAQYHPEHQVGGRGDDGSVKFADINRRPHRDEITAAYLAAREAGLWRFDKC
jgi:putative pyruvate formate lyase activating enzyme